MKSMFAELLPRLSLRARAPAIRNADLRARESMRECTHGQASYTYGGTEDARIMASESPREVRRGESYAR